ncbi:MAG TPA: hypothetical protein VH817_03525 [Thermoleophilaceae bacterium]|jgi:hypothetical protein
MTDRIKLGLLTTWNTRCGIAEYSRYIVEQLHKRDDVDVTVLGSINHGDYKLREDEDFVVPVFEMALWANGSDRLLVDKILEQDLDILHVQYQMLFYNPPLFEELLRRFEGRKVITYHDNDFPPNFPADAFDFRYTHRLGVGMGECAQIAHGLENRPPVIKTFGRGRSRADIIGAICERNGWQFEAFFGGTSKAWMETPDLYRWLRDSDAIALWYDEAKAAGSSGAVRIAISTRRPVVCNSTTWFNEIPAEGPNFTKVDTPDEFEAALKAQLDNDFIDRDSWERIAERHVTDYRMLLDRRRPIQDAREFAVVAFADELIADPSLLAGWGRAFGGDDPVTLVIRASDADAAQLAQAVETCGLDGESDADLLALDSEPARLAEGATAVYTRRSLDGVFASVPSYDDSALSALRGLLENGASAN